MQPANEVIYNGKRILKHHFRAFIYGLEGQTKLVNSWDEFEGHISTSLWFASKDDIPSKAPKAQRKKPLKEVEDVVIKESGAFEVIEEDFLPNEAGE